MIRRLTLIGALVSCLAIGPVYGAQEICPEGYYWSCNGGILGAQCRCVKEGGGDGAVDPLDLMWEIDGGSVTESAGVQLVLSAQIPTDSDCRIDFELKIRELAGPELETQTGSLIATAPWYQLNRSPSSQFVRLNASGQAYDCPIAEFLSFEALAVGTDSETGSPISLLRVRPTFRPMENDSSVLKTPPPILPPNRLPPGYFEAIESGDD
jgi:hypothetical protein